MDYAISDSIGGERGAGRTRRPWLKGALVVVGLVALAAIIWWAWDRDAIVRWKHSASPLRFFPVMAIAPAFGVPITPLFVLAGATFGRRVALIGSGIALTANLALCYLVARSALRPWIMRLMRRFDYELPDFKRKRQGVWRFTLMVKAAPGIPQFVKNYGLGVAGVPFGLYLVSSLVFTGAYGVGLIVLGESLFRHDRNRAIIVGAVVVVAAVGVWWWLRRRKRAAA